MRLKHLPLYFALLFFSLLQTSCTKEQEPIGPKESKDSYIKGSLIIRFADESALEQLQPTLTKADEGIALQYGVTSLRRLFPHAGKFEERTRKEGLHLWYVVEFDRESPLTKAQTEFLTLSGVAEVELISKIKREESGPIIPALPQMAPQRAPLAAPLSAQKESLPLPYDDPRLGDQWHYHNSGEIEGSVAGADIDLFSAWVDYGMGPNQVIVSVVDHGIDFNHEDLKGNMWVNSAELYGTPDEDDDANGYKDDIYGYNFKAQSSIITPGNHGCHVAGTIAAVNNNAIGVAGVAGGDYKRGIPGAKLMSCQIFSELDEDEDKSSNSAEAIKYGADNGAIISQNSWSYKELIPLPSSMKAAIDYFIKYAGLDENGNQVGAMKGGIVIFSAGNKNQEESSPQQYEEVMAVSAIAPNFKKASYSNFGSWVNIAAPGGQTVIKAVLSTIKENQYGYLQGTSMSCPHVSGVAALLISHLGGEGFTNRELWDLLIENTHPIDQYNPDYSGKLGVGMVNAHYALSANSTTPPEAVKEIRAEGVLNTLELEWSLTADPDNGRSFGYRLFYSLEPIADFDPANPPPTAHYKEYLVPYHIAIDESFKVTLQDLIFDSNYHIRVSAFDYSGNHSPLSPEIVAKTGIKSKPIINSLDGNSLTLKAFETKSLRFQYHHPNHYSMSWKSNLGSEAATATEENQTITVVIDGNKAPAGNYNGSITVTDEMGDSREELFNYQIMQNQPPQTVATPDNHLFNNLGERTTLDLTHYFNDPDGEPLNYHIYCNPEGRVLYSVEEDQLTLTSASFGEATLTIKATDVKQREATTSLKVLTRDGSKEIDIFPNPVTRHLTIRPDREKELEVTLHNSLGAKLYQGKLNATPFLPYRIDMGEYRSGLYTLIVIEREGGKERKHQESIIKL